MPPRWLRRFVAEEDGPSAVEYALMLALIILVCVASIEALGGANSAFWAATIEAISGAVQIEGG